MTATMDSATAERTANPDHEEELRAQAIKRLEARSDFWSHDAAYVLVNGLLAAIWFAVGADGVFWPIFPLLGWGIGLFVHAVETYRRPFTAERIRQEMDRLR